MTSYFKRAEDLREDIGEITESMKYVIDQAMLELISSDTLEFEDRLAILIKYGFSEDDLKARLLESSPEKGKSSENPVGNEPGF